MDLRNGLASDIDIKIGDTIFNQSLDYIGIPFKCNRCHSHGYLASQCHLSLGKKSILGEGIKPNLVWRVKHSGSPVVSDEGRDTTLFSREKGLDCSDEGVVSLTALKPVVLPFQGVAHGISDEVHVNGHPIKNLINNSPETHVSDSGYYLRSCTNLYGNVPFSSRFGGGWDALGLRTEGLSLKENEQYHSNGTLRAMMSLALVTL